MALPNALLATCLQHLPERTGQQSPGVLSAQEELASQHSQASQEEGHG